MSTILRVRVALLILAVLSVGVVAGCGDDDDSDSAAISLDGKELVDETGSDAITVDAVDNSFRPQYIQVSPGTTVTFENRGRNVHNVIAADEGAFESIEADDFEPQDSVDVTFDEAGDYAYYCSLHGNASSGMIGGIRVVE
jgi:plastocyanin